MGRISEKKALEVKGKVPIITCNGKYYRLNPRQEMFCREYVATCNAKESYEKSYGPKKYSDVAAYKMLSRPYIQIRIQQILQATGFDDLAVAAQHLKLITQDNSLPVKHKAIDMFYKLRGLYAPEKREVTTTHIKEERKKYIDSLISDYESD
jgi:hypothetical protein